MSVITIPAWSNKTAQKGEPYEYCIWALSQMRLDTLSFGRYTVTIGMRSDTGRLYQKKGDNRVLAKFVVTCAKDTVRANSPSDWQMPLLLELLEMLNAGKIELPDNYIANSSKRWEELRQLMLNAEC
jgi:hypothetical protein